MNKVVCANEVVRSAMVAALVRLNAIAAFLAVQRYPSNSSDVAWVLIAYGGLNRFFCADDHHGCMCMYSPDCFSTPILFMLPCTEVDGCTGIH